MWAKKGFIFVALAVSTLFHVSALLLMEWGSGQQGPIATPSSVPGQLMLTWRQVGDAASSTARDASRAQSENVSGTVAINNEATFDAAPVAVESATLRAPVALYLPPSQLTHVPRPLHEIVTSPPGLKLSGLVGEAQIMLLISETGHVDAALVGGSSLPNEMVSYAVAQFRQARFTPGRIEEKAVKSRIRIVLTPPEGAVEAGHPWSVKNRRKETPI